MAKDDNENDQLDVAYAVVEVKRKPSGRAYRSFVAIEGKTTIGNVLSGDKEIMEAYVRRLYADSSKSGREYVLAKYAFVEDMMSIKKREP